MSGKKTKTDIERFENLYIPEPNSGCWIWIGGISDSDYSRFWFESRVRPAYRFAYKYYVGEVPDGLKIDHLCRVHLCVNPKHLEAVTHIENCRRGIKGVLTTHCPSGHEYAGQNLIIKKNGHRDCRACKQVQDAAYRARPASRKNHAEYSRLWRAGKKELWKKLSVEN